MPLYEFRLVGGTEIIEKFFRVAECPDLGTIIEVDGKKYERILSSGLCITPDPYQGEREDITFPRGNDLGAGLGPKGHPIIKNRQHDREICAKYGFTRD